VGSLTEYDDDIVAWSEHQAALLRSLAERVPGLPNDLDLLNLAEEIEDVGKSVVRSARSFLTLILTHLLKAASVGNDHAIAHWRAEVASFHRQFRDELTPSLKNHIDIDKQWKHAIKEARLQLAAEGDHLVKGPASRCSFGFEDIADPGFDFDTAVARIAATRQNSAA
jgi:hypothetical protein